jgi:hypothetical protein
VTVTVAATTFVASATFVPGEAAVIGAMRRLTARVFVRPRIGGRDINVGESAVMRKRRINAGLEGS